MRSDAPPLLPVFRSRPQAEMLTWLMLHPEREFALTELATRVDAPVTTIHREANRLETAGLIASRAHGRNRLVHARTDHMTGQALQRLLEVTFGPRHVVTEEFAEVGADLVLIFGSWAARYAGHPGPPPNDVDVMVVGQVDRGMVYAAADRAQERLGFDVNPVVRSAERWAGTDDPLVEQVRISPFVMTNPSMP